MRKGRSGKNKESFEFDNSFYQLANQVTAAIAKNKDGSEQKEQVEELLEAEEKFRECICKYRQSKEIYKKFLQKICIINKNILSARPYFRETSKNFSKYVTPAIKSENIEELKKFHINYQFILFIKESWLGPFPKKAEVLFQRVHRARQILIENNIPLAINRAKLFYRKTPKAHLSLMDMIGICSMGLAAGVDKWCGPYSPVFRSVCIGRMVGYLISEYSDTFVHFYPSDRRILYKANTIKGRRGIDEIEELTAAVNQSFKDDGEEGKNVPKKDVTVSELSELLSAASTVSADIPLDEDGRSIYATTADSSKSAEDIYIEQESLGDMYTAIKTLPIIHRKVLRLKGIKF